MRLHTVAVGACLLAGACITVYEDAPLVETKLEIPEFAVAQTIAFGKAPFSEQDRMLMQLYGGVIRRLQEAAEDRDPATMFDLLNAYEKPNLPDWLGGRLRGYRALGHGLAFVEHAVSRSTLKLTAKEPAVLASAVEAAANAEPLPVPAIGAPLRFEFAIPAAGSPIRLGGRSDPDPIGFAIAIMIEDVYVDGGTRTQRNNDIEWLSQAVLLSGDDVFRLPLLLDVPASNAVRRTLHLRIDLIGGYVQVGGHRAPVPRRTLAAIALTQWPAGYEPIVEKPLVSLREALRLGDEKHFPHVFLGAWFTTGAEREQAIELLIDQVRFAPQPLAVVAMATLRELTGVDETIGDREAWLEWWNLRR